MNPLEKFLRESTAEEKFTVACHAGTTVNYLYQIASGERSPNVQIAVGIESGTRAVASRRPEVQAVTCQEIADIGRVKIQ